MTGWRSCGALLLISLMAGCGGPRNETIIPDAPEPLSDSLPECGWLKNLMHLAAVTADPGEGSPVSVHPLR